MATAQSLRRLNAEARKRAIMKLRLHRAGKRASERRAATLIAELIAIGDDEGRLTDEEIDGLADDKKH